MKEYRRLNKTDIQAFYNINQEIAKYITCAEWFNPFSMETVSFMLGENSTHVVYGCFVDGELAGVSLFDYDKEQCAWLSKVVGADPAKCGAEVGGSIVLPKFRGQNIMFEINDILIKEAKKMGVDYFVATAHPDNVASNSSLKKLGLQFKALTKNHKNSPRNAYYMDL